MDENSMPENNEKTFPRQDNIFQETNVKLDE